MRYKLSEFLKAGRCKVCNKSSILISSFLGVCKECILNRFENTLPYIEEAHRKAKAYFGLPYPSVTLEPSCNLCIHRCSLLSDKSFCGLIEKGERFAGTPERGLLEWYYDPLPTNCVASFICPERRHYGYKNLAIFYAGCNFNCLFCQNWHYHYHLNDKKPIYSIEDLEKLIDSHTVCICFFGGDPTPQVLHALTLARKVKDRVRICWETNGSMNPDILKEIFEISLESGGIIKFDLKAYDERIHIALTGVSNRQTLDNFSWLAEESKRCENIILVASTLLVPGYIDEEEVESIARFIAKINSEIPYSLLAFSPNFFFGNLPTTSKRHAENSLNICKAIGLRHINLGNTFLLSNYY